MPEAEIPAALDRAIPPRRALERLSAAAGIDLAELALRYVLGIDGVTSAVIGMETVEQVRPNLAYAANGPLEPALMKAIEQTVPELPHSILMPTLWPPPQNQPKDQEVNHEKLQTVLGAF
jgi:aryl-alcohol dehydrogenase-like predicted oxidoreductase